MNFLGTELIFGSQTGTARDVANWLKWRFHERTYSTEVFEGNDLAADLQIVSGKLYVFILSTAGNGDPPLNFRRFWDRLFDQGMPRLEGVKIAVFGLGDSKYPQFNFAARMLFGRLKSLGAVPIIPLGCGDDQHKLGYSQEFIPWFHLLWRTVFGEDFSPFSHLPKSTVLVDTVSSADPTSPADSAIILSNKRLTHPDHFQDIRSISLRLPGVWNYLPGDVLSVLPRVSHDVARKFITEILDDDPARIVRIESKDIHTSVSLMHLFTRILDITATPNHFFYEVLYHSCLDQIRDITCLSSEQETVRDKLELLAAFTADGVEERLHYSSRERMSIHEVLFDFKNANVHVPALYRLIESIPRITPRYYSVCNVVCTRRDTKFFPQSRIAFHDVEICAGIVDYTTLYGRHRRGLASGFLASLVPGEIVSGSFRMERGFTSDLPRMISDSQTLILVAPGTGIAPARAIVNRFKETKKILVLSSFRNAKTDFLFKGDFIERWPTSRNVSSIVAWSRPDTMDRSLDHSWSMWSGSGMGGGTGSAEGRKTWVQDLIPIHYRKIEEMFKGKCLVIVCGRSHPMPQQVRDELFKIHRDIDSCIVYDTWG